MVLVSQGCIVSLQTSGLRRADDDEPATRVVNIDGSRVVNPAEPLVGAHCDIYHDEIATLVLLGAGLLQGGPARTRSRQLTSWNVP